jgi:hypothetical protein
MSGRAANTPPALIALLLQAAAAAAILLTLRGTGIAAPPLLAALACGLLAAALSRLAGLERWWLLIQLLFAPLLVLMLTLDVRPGIYLGLFIALLLVYWSTFQTRVPLYLSGAQTWRALETLLPPASPTRTLRCIDLGCGLGGVVTHLAAARPDGEFHGIELAPLPALVSRLRIALGQHANARATWGSFWNTDLADYDVVFAFLSPVPMPQLWAKARAEMRAGSLFVSSTFAVPGQDPERVIEVADRKRARLHVYRM